MIGTNGNEEILLSVEGDLERIKDRHKKSMNNIIDHEYSIVEYRKKNQKNLANIKSKVERWEDFILRRDHNTELEKQEREKENQTKTIQELENLIYKQKKAEEKVK